MNSNIGGVKARREGALLRLQTQLKEGTKPLALGEKEPLQPKDITRIEKEITILKSRI